MVITIINIIIMTCFLVYYFYKFKWLQEREAHVNWKLNEVDRILSEVQKDREEVDQNKALAEKELANAEFEAKLAQQNNNEAQQRRREADAKYNEVLNKYNEEYNKLTSFIADQRAARQLELDDEMEKRESVALSEFDKHKNELNKQINLLASELEEYKNQIQREREQLDNDLAARKQKFNSLLEPLRKYEIDKQEQLFYTIQVPNEYKEDINFLITTVSQKVQHPDIINKLVWAEYVKPYLDETIKRAGIEEKPGIYKLTNIVDGKCYIGKSTNLKKRIQDHFKASLHLGTVSHQAVHDAIWRDGFWNWMIEPVTYCNKEELSELEKYYIDFFKAQEFGYNKNQGG